MRHLRGTCSREVSKESYSENVLSLQVERRDSPRRSHKRERQNRSLIRAFADVCLLALRNANSRNVSSSPRKLATKLELRDMPRFDPPHDKLKMVYDDLIRYSVFLRDVRGKSMPGAVAPRLFLRRLLIPTFHLTFSKRDNISLEVGDFYLLLSDPDMFKKTMRRRFRTDGQDILFRSEDISAHGQTREFTPASPAIDTKD